MSTMGPAAHEEAAIDHPREGELVVHCGHIFKGRQSVHWMLGKIGIRPPGGPEVFTRWMAACEACYVGADGDPSRIEWRGHYIDTGEPLYVLQKE